MKRERAPPQRHRGRLDYNMGNVELLKPDTGVVFADYRHFKRHRRHQSEKHLQEQHYRQRRVSPIEHARWDRIEYRPRLAMPPPLPAVVKITTVSLSADCDPQPESAEPAIKTSKRGDASELKLLNASHTAFPSTKERAQLVTDLSMSVLRVKARSVHAFVYTARDLHIEPGTYSSPYTRTPGFHGSHVLVSPISFVFII
jgi:hypothetical protein